jgi:hypothetical protein
VPPAATAPSRLEHIDRIMPPYHSSVVWDLTDDSVMSGSSTTCLGMTIPMTQEIP